MSFEDATLSGHAVELCGIEGGSTIAHCSCGKFLGYDNQYKDGDFDALAVLVQAHRSEAERDERAAARQAKLNEKRWHIWVRTDRYGEFAYSSHETQGEAERLVQSMRDLMPEDQYWIVDRDAS